VTLVLNNIRFRYPNERFQFQVREFAAAEEETIAVVGPSGCGKTTLLRLIAGILRPQDGNLRVLGESLTDLSEHQIRQFRISSIGLVFQEFELLDYLSARDNILLPFHLTSKLSSNENLHERVDSLARETGISALLEAYPKQLSQGERQRVAICRALITRPKLLLADEPTGSLDPDNQQRIVDLLIGQAKAQKATLLMVTHDHQLLGNFERTVNLPSLMS
tara:strand:- start:5790 stop:6449 length:660 start_codon:yes stop_codon:yes gene_type:complete